MFDPIIPIFPEQINPEAVCRRIDDVEQASANRDELPGIDEAFEDGILHALPIIEACLRRASESAPSRRCSRGNIVGDEDLHSVEL